MIINYGECFVCQISNGVTFEVISSLDVSDGIVNMTSATVILRKALKSLKPWERPRTINTDKAPAFISAISELAEEGKCHPDIEHRSVKYLNNRIDSDQGKLKRVIKHTLGFKSMKTAYATLKGFEVMRMFRKRQFDPWLKERNVRGEIRLINEAFNIYPV